MFEIKLKKKTIIFEPIGFGLRARFKEGGTLPKSLMGTYTNETIAREAVRVYEASLNVKEG